MFSNELVQVVLPDENKPDESQSSYFNSKSEHSMQTLEDIAKETLEIEKVEFCAIQSRMFPPKLNAATFGESAVWSHKNTTVISDRPFNINNDSCVIIRPGLNK